MNKSCICKVVYINVLLAYLFEVGVPAAPRNFRLTACESRLAQLEWSCDQPPSLHHVTVAHYVIEYRTSFDGDDDWRVGKTTSTSAGARRQLCVQRLAVSPGAAYSFRVTAEDWQGRRGPSSRPTAEWCRAAPDVPHHNPRGVCSRNTRPGVLHIVWQVIRVGEFFTHPTCV